MKKLFVIIISALSACVLCNAQIKVPVQTDTLVIKSMQYHFNEIRPENYPFKYVIRKAQAFVFDDQEFIISRSDEGIGEQLFWFENVSGVLKITKLNDGQIKLDFLGYLLKCAPKSEK